MGEALNMKKMLLPIVAYFLMVVSVNVFAAPPDWEILPSVHTVRSLVRAGNDLWGATNSGLFKFDLENHTFQVFSTVDGLSSTDIQKMVADERGNLILGMDNAYVDIFNTETHQVERISDFRLNTKIFDISALHLYEGGIYVGTDIGVSHLVYYENLDKYLIEGNYVTLGNFSTEIKATAIQVYNGGLWVGTEAGLARGDLSAPVLESPTSWTNYTTAQGLSSNEILALAVFRDTLYVAADDGLNRLVGDSFEPLTIPYTNNITFLKAYQDTLYFGKSTGIYRLVEGQSLKYGPNENKGLCLEFEEDGTMWAGTQTGSVSGYGIKRGGLKTWSGEEWVLYAPDGPLVETVTDLLIEDDGSAWVTGRIEYGSGNGSLCYFDGEHWANLGKYYDNYYDLESASPDSFFWYWTRAITMDHSGKVWAASDGRGAGWFEYVEDTLISVGDSSAMVDTLIARGYFSQTTGGLFNIEASAHYCVVRDLLTDDWGNVWICNSEADPILGPPIAVVPSEFIADPESNPDWFYMTVRDENGNVVPDAKYQVDRIAQDSFGRKWFGANNNHGKGIYILDDNKSPFDIEDDLWTHIEYLPSDSVTAIVCDRDGIVWVGTPAGVQYFYPEENPEFLYGIDLPYIPVGSAVSTIAVDPQNNKWFGTATGLCVLASDNFTWLEDFKFTTLDGAYPSPLPGDVVQAIAFNPSTGDAYIGTDKGLACLSTPYKQMGQAISSVSIWPNPFLIGGGEDNRLYFDVAGLSEATEVKIFTTAGFLVRHLNLQEINLGWDGRNSRGELVGSGIYFLLAYSSGGESEVGKVAVVHR